MAIVSNESTRVIPAVKSAGSTSSDADGNVVRRPASAVTPSSAIDDACRRQRHIQGATHRVEAEPEAEADQVHLVRAVDETEQRPAQPCDEAGGLRRRIVATAKLRDVADGPRVALELPRRRRLVLVTARLDGLLIPLVPPRLNRAIEDD